MIKASDILCDDGTWLQGLQLTTLPLHAFWSEISFVKSVLCEVPPSTFNHPPLLSQPRSRILNVFLLHLSLVGKKKKSHFRHFISRSLHILEGDDQQLKPLFLPSRSTPAQPSSILYLPARGTRPLKSPGSLFLPRVSINLLRGRRMLREPKPPN